MKQVEDLMKSDAQRGLFREVLPVLCCKMCYLPSLLCFCSWKCVQVKIQYKNRIINIHDYLLHYLRIIFFGVKLVITHSYFYKKYLFWYHLKALFLLLQMSNRNLPRVIYSGLVGQDRLTQFDQPLKFISTGQGNFYCSINTSVVPVSDNKVGSNHDNSVLSSQRNHKGHL